MASCEWTHQLVSNDSVYYNYVIKSENDDKPSNEIGYIFMMLVPMKIQIL